MKNTIFAPLFLFSFLFFAACKGIGNTNDALLCVPKNALSISAVEPKNLMEKADWNALQQLDFFKESLQKAQNENPAMVEIMKDPTLSGIDLTKKIYWVQGLPTVTGKVNVKCFFSLSDVTAFKKMIQNAGASAIVESKGVNVVAQAKGVVAWNDKTAILSIGGNNRDEREDIVRYFNLEKEESIASNRNITNAFDAKHDFFSVFSSNALSENAELRAAAAYLGIESSALKENYVTTYTDFENGKAVSTTNFDVKKELTDKFAFIFKDKVTTSFNSYMPYKRDITLSFGIDWEGVKKMMKSNPQTAILTMGMAQYGVSIEDLAAAFQGDILVVVTNLDNQQMNTDSRGYIALKIKNKEKVGQVLEAIQGKQQISTENMRIQHDILFLGNDSYNMGNKSDHKEVVEKGIFSLSIDFQELMNRDLTEIQDLKMTLNGKGGDAILTTSNKDENSLKSIMKALNNFYLKNKNNRNDLNMRVE